TASTKMLNSRIDRVNKLMGGTPPLLPAFCLLCDAFGGRAAEPSHFSLGLPSSNPSTATRKDQLPGLHCVAGARGDPTVGHWSRANFCQSSSTPHFNHVHFCQDRAAADYRELLVHFHAVAATTVDLNHVAGGLS